MICTEDTGEGNTSLKTTAQPQDRGSVVPVPTREQTCRSMGQNGVQKQAPINSQLISDRSKDRVSDKSCWNHWTSRCKNEPHADLTPSKI